MDKLRSQLDDLIAFARRQHTAADTRRSLQQRDVNTGLRQRTGCGKPSHSGAQDQDVGLRSRMLRIA